VQREELLFVVLGTVRPLPHRDEGRTTIEELEEDAAERVEIGRRTDVRERATDLLRSHETGRSAARGRCDLRGRGAVEARVVSIAHEEREPEIEHVHRRIAALDAL
jgi:hypothetical protein